MKSDTIQRAFSLAIDALGTELDSSITKINDKHQALKKQHQHLIDRQEALANKHGGADVELSDIIHLNVRGTELFARRDTLTAVKSSRLEALFNGRWENQLLRDDQGRVFMDVDPKSFKKILEYLYMVKISEDGDAPPMSKVDESMKDMFDSYLDFFKLRSEEKITSKASLPNQTPVVSTSIDQKEMLVKMKQELDTIEKALENEESFVAFFTKDHNDGDSATDESRSSEISLSTSHKSDDLCSKPESKSPVRNGIITLYLNGDIVAYKVSTLCRDMTSKLAQDLSDKSWVREHTIVTEDGKVCVLVEYPGAEVKALVDHIHLKSISSFGTTEEAKNVRLSIVSEYMPRLIKYLYGDDSEMVQSITVAIESTIITSMDDEEKIKEWLASAGKTEQPKLLYRASRDGWTAADFHRMCDGKGATITVVKCSGGYIFGGYTDVAWGTNGYYKSSSESFLYSLKYHAGIGPVKMPIKSNTTARAHAVGHNLSYGPMFGNGKDLHISSNANGSGVSSSAIGETYERPADCSDKHFLTGSPLFTVSEYEVFLVHNCAPTKKRKATTECFDGQHAINV
eukprot:scaffold652_cov188-Chaetoceros_neogracile.AAC.14